MTKIQRIERLAPLEERIRDELLALIKDGQFGADQQLPSEADLAKEFGVSRATIRAGLSMLASQGIVQRKHGSGTFVNQWLLRLRIDVGEQWEFNGIIQKSGYAPDIQFIDSRICPAEEEVAAALQISPDDSVLRIRKIFTADGLPAIYSINVLSLQIAAPPFDEEKIKGPIFPYLGEAFGQLPAYSVTDVYPVVATPELAVLLKVEPLSPLLLFKDIFFNSENEPILYGQNHFTDLLHFKAIRQPNQSWV